MQHFCITDDVNDLLKQPVKVLRRKLVEYTLDLPRSLQTLENNLMAVVLED